MRDGIPQSDASIILTVIVLSNDSFVQTSTCALVGTRRLPHGVWAIPSLSARGERDLGYDHSVGLRAPDTGIV